MYRYISVLCVWLFIAVSASAAELPQTGAAQAGFDKATLDKMDAHFNGYVDSGKFSGYTSIVARKGQVVHANTYGMEDISGNEPMQPDSLFRIYSMTKPITGVALMMLYEEGKFKLDDPVSKYLPSFKNQRVFSGLTEEGNIETVPARRATTIRDLLRHTGGLSYGVFSDTPVDMMYRDTGITTGLFAEGEEESTGTEKPDLASLTNKLGGMPLLYQPGDAWVYSLGVDVQGRLIEVLSGQTLDVFFKERIFKPLDMKDTGFSVRSDQIDRFVEIYALDQDKKLVPYRGEFYWDFTKTPLVLSGGGGLLSTARDYLRFAQMMANGGTLDGARLLKPETVAMMTQDQLPGELNGISGKGAVGFGLDFAVVKDTDILKSPGRKGEYYWSGMANTIFWVDPEEDIVAVMLVNVLPFGIYTLREEMRDYVYGALKQ
ncbi:serine hydrolase domain-containing protein [Kordiimonas pumila]|uniref:Serine hydrolase domain-containing protein n=1 Tax=Kordiimonas pumila TaxID=2161677 RepID=A0ABV7D5N9_9PROT|nr:serine hydrolase domain-containing protein [Kordiimonas pumila]